jgi:hypothetical protein
VSAHPAELRALHLAMLDAVLVGEGLGAVAALAAAECGGPVALVVPRLEILVGSEGAEAGLGRLRAYVLERCRGRVTPVPPGVVAEVPIVSGGELLGAVLLLGDVAGDESRLERLRLVAVAALTEIALAQARATPAEGAAAGSTLLGALTAGEPLGREEVVRRAARAGCDLRGGATALCCELHVERPHHVAALVRDDWPGALAEHVARRLYALLPAGDGPGVDTLASRLARHGPVGIAAGCEDPAGLGRALAAAGLALDLPGSSGPPWEVASADEDAVRAHYDATVAPVVRYDGVYDTDLMHTLALVAEAGQDADAAAAELGVPAHRVRYRLDKVRELSGLDAGVEAERRRLAVGVRCWRVLAPALPG